jgi:hypothetical protein
VTTGIVDVVVGHEVLQVRGAPAVEVEGDEAVVGPLDIGVAHDVERAARRVVVDETVAHVVSHVVPHVGGPVRDRRVPVLVVREQVVVDRDPVSVGSVDHAVVVLTFGVPLGRRALDGRPLDGHVVGFVEVDRLVHAPRDRDVIEDEA